MTRQVRGAYIARLDIGQPHLAGVAKKMDAQAAALAGALGPVDTWALRGATVTCNGTPVHQGGTGRMARRWLRMVGFYRVVLPRLGTADYIYIRYQRSTPAFLAFLRALKQAAPARPIIVEIPTYPYEAEQLSLRDKALGRIDRMCRPFLKRHVDRIVTFSDRPAIFGIPAVQTDNGVALAGASPLPPPVGGGALRLIGVANLGLRHAYDRVIDGLAAHVATGNSRTVVFDVIGSGEHEPALRARATAHGLLGRQVNFLGPMTGAALDASMARAHMGISALGMHRIRAETSDIKSREYCARGLPFVMSNPDRDFGPDFRFAHPVAADDTPVDIGAVLAFHDRLCADVPDYPQQMRAYAEARLTWQAKLAPVVVAIRAILMAQG